MGAFGVVSVLFDTRQPYTQFVMVSAGMPAPPEEKLLSLMEEETRPPPENAMFTEVRVTLTKLLLAMTKFPKLSAEDMVARKASVLARPVVPSQLPTNSSEPKL